jgi:adenylate kinase
MQNVVKFETFVQVLESELNERVLPDKQGKILVILGPPGSGKGTVSKKLSERNGFVHISTGELIRKSEDKELKKLVSGGNFIPDRLMVRMLRKALGEADFSKGVIIDGFPRNLKQVKLLDSLLGKLGVGLSHVLFLDLDEKKAKERILKRAEKENREDDKDPEVIAKRFKEYQEKTSPLIDKYKKSRKLVTVDASEGSEGVYNSVVKKLEIPNKKKDEGKEKSS